MCLALHCRGGRRKVGRWALLSENFICVGGAQNGSWMGTSAQHERLRSQVLDGWGRLQGLLEPRREELSMLAGWSGIASWRRWAAVTLGKKSVANHSHRCWSLSLHSVPNIMLGAFCILLLFQLTALWGRHYYLPFFRWENRGSERWRYLPVLTQRGAEPGLAFSIGRLWRLSLSHDS